jgi:exodeoxyribonuclease III
VRILALNLRGGGGPRIGRLADYLCDSDADVVVACEFVPGPRGETLNARLGAAGFLSFHLPARPRGRYTVLLATRRRSTAVDPDVAPADQGRLVAARCGEVTVAGVYFNQNRDKASLFDFLLSRPPFLGGEGMVIGDWNTGLRRIDEPGATFACADRFEMMERRGYVDLWRRQHGSDAREVSWVSTNGLGYRIDHAFGTGPLAERVLRCDYDHSTRGDISDHSALIVEIAT